jgi:hypothetical protein
VNSTADGERELLLVRSWLHLGQPEKAIQSCRSLLEKRPELEMGWRFLLEQLLHQGRSWEGLEICQRLLDQHPLDRSLQLTHGVCLQAWEEHRCPDQSEGKLCLFGQKRFPSHRSGWGYALDALRPLHHRRGLLFDGFLEHNFAWRYRTEGPRSNEELNTLRQTGWWFERQASSQELGLIPYRRPWVGFFHNPPAMPPGFHDVATPQAILDRPLWKESISYCQGLFTLSEYLATWLRRETGLPVVALTAPSERPELVFDPERFRANRQPKILQVGWWLRRLTSIYRLPVLHHYRKVWLVTLPFDHAREHFLTLMDLEGGCPFCPNTEEVEHLSDQLYDQWLAENVVFVDLYDTSANNAVVECLARATPLLINPHPAVVEYLGPAYPLYFESLQQAADKVMDLDLVCRAHFYLKELPLRQEISAEAFCSAMKSSSIYQRLPGHE